MHEVRIAAILLLTVIFPPRANTQQGDGHHLIVPLKPDYQGQEIVSGDPDKPGAQFVIRIKNDDGQVVRPHWHPEDEHITVVKGSWHVGMGDKFDRTVLQEMNVGDYALMPKAMLHFAWSDGETIVQVHGIGPFRILPAPGDERADLADSKAASIFKYRRNDRVKSAKGEGTIIGGNSALKSNLIQYRIQRSNGTIFWALESAVQKIG